MGLNKLKELISNGLINESFEALSANKISNELEELMSDWEEVQRKFRLGIITQEYFTGKQNEMTYNLLNYISQLENDSTNKEQAGINEMAKEKLNKYFEYKKKKDASMGKTEIIKTILITTSIFFVTMAVVNDGFWIQLSLINILVLVLLKDRLNDL